MADSQRTTPLQERAQAAREAIVAAVDPVVAKYGVDEASTNRIAEEAGVSVGTVYRYFPNKYVLFEEYIERYRAQLDVQATEFLESQPDLGDINGIARAMILRSAERLAENPGYANLRLWRRPDSGELIAAPVRAQESAMIAYVMADVLPDAHELDPGVADRFIEIVIETTMTLLAQAPPAGPERDDYLDDVVLMVTAYITARKQQEVGVA